MKLETLGGTGLAVALGMVALAIWWRRWGGASAAWHLPATVWIATAAFLVLAAGAAALESGCRSASVAGDARSRGPGRFACILSPTLPAASQAAEVVKKPEAVWGRGEARPGGQSGNLTAIGSASGTREVGQVGEVGGPRPFLHSRHVRIDCVECHGPGERHRLPIVWTAQTCASCHHDPVRDFSCAACHQEETYGGPRTVEATMDLTVWKAPRRRALPFDHGDHEGVGCRECHQAAETLAPRECSTCHVNHHRPDAVCTQCHLLPDSEVHGLAVHLTCSSSLCHTAETARRPVLSRTFCLTCHAEQRDHHPEGNCSTCHMTGGLQVAGAGGRPLPPFGGARR